MDTAKQLAIEIGGSEDAVTTFARDQLMALRCADDAVARARIWRRRAAGLLLGRFHRADVSAPALEGECRISRRLSGGRVVPVGPGVVCITMAVPVVDWLDRASGSLRPEQVLNRALRPLLALLREAGVEAFYGGRDLVTAAGHPVAHTSFTVMRDGTAIVEMHVAEQPSFVNLPELLDEYDPQGVAGVDRTAFAGATSIAEIAAGKISEIAAGKIAEIAAGKIVAASAPGGAAETGSAATYSNKSDEEWAAGFARVAATMFACETSLVEANETEVTMADERAAHAFIADPGPVAAGMRTVAQVAMLGVVECSGALYGDRLTNLRITGDLIAPFHTLDDIAHECEKQPLRPDYIRKALARALAQPRSFLLGLRELDELIVRLA